MQVELPTGDVVTYTWAPVNKSAEERIVQRDDGATVTQYLWDNNNVLRETDDVGAVEAAYTYRPQPFGDLVAQHRDGDSTFYQFDALGSTTGLTDATGAVTDDYRYEAFGKTAASTGSTETPYQWVGQLGYRHDDSTRDYNLRNRQYDPQTGQFLSVDPLGLTSGDSNFYRYVANSPINLSDPSGLDSRSTELEYGTGAERGKLFLRCRSTTTYGPFGVFWSNRNQREELGTLDAFDHVTRDALVIGPDGKVERNAHCKVHRQTLLAGIAGGTLRCDNIDDFFLQHCSDNPQPPMPAKPLPPPVPPKAVPSGPGASPPAAPAAPACPASQAQPDFLTVTIQPSCFESVLGEQPTTIRIWYERRGGADADWDIQRLKLQAAARKIESIGSLKATKRSLAEGIVVGEVVVRSTFDAADTVDAVATFANDPTVTNAGNVLLASIPFFFTPGLFGKAADDLPGGGGKAGGNAPKTGPLGKGVGPDDVTPDGFSYDIDSPKFQTYKQGGSKIDFNIDGKTLNIDWIEGPNASSFVKKIIDAEGCNVNRIVGYTVDKLGNASDAALLKAANQIAASLGNGWTASITKDGTKRFIIFTR